MKKTDLQTGAMLGLKSSGDSMIPLRLLDTRVWDYRRNPFDGPTYRLAAPGIRPKVRSFGDGSIGYPAVVAYGNNDTEELAALQLPDPADDGKWIPELEQSLKGTNLHFLIITNLAKIVGTWDEAQKKADDAHRAKQEQQAHYRTLERQRDTAYAEVRKELKALGISPRRNPDGYHSKDTFAHVVLTTDELRALLQRIPTTPEES